MLLGARGKYKIKINASLLAVLLLVVVPGGTSSLVGVPGGTSLLVVIVPVVGFK